MCNIMVQHWFDLDLAIVTLTLKSCYILETIMCNKLIFGRDIGVTYMKHIDLTFVFVTLTSKMPETTRCMKLLLGRDID